MPKLIFAYGIDRFCHDVAQIWANEVIALVCLSKHIALTDQPKKKALFLCFAAEHPLREIIFFAEKKNKNHLFRQWFSPWNFGEKLRESTRKNSVTFPGETPWDYAEKLREILRWVGKDLRFLHAFSEDSDQTEKLSKFPAWYEFQSTGQKTNFESLCPQYNHRMCGHSGGTVYR